jgi:hypothetical protein
MSNDKDFKVKKGVKPTVYHEKLGTVVLGSGTATLDLSTGSVFQLTPASNIQLNLSNPAASGTVSGATLLLSTSGTAYTITYDSSIDFPGGTAPTSPAIGDTDVLVFTTRDGGTSYKAALAIDGAV